MVYKYLAYNEAGEIVKGKLAASDEDEATELLSYAGYRTVSLKPSFTFAGLETILTAMARISPSEIITLYRQMAMLLESGSNVSASLEILQKQMDNRAMRKILGIIISDVRGGSQLSLAMSKHPKVFLPMHGRLINIGEQSGNLETILTQIADDMEKEVAVSKETKNAMMYPVITLLVTVVVVGVLLTYVMLCFSSLYLSLGIELPLITRIMISISDTASQSGLYVGVAVAIIGVLGLFYVRTKAGRFNLDKLKLRLPYLGRVGHLIELARSCRSLALLFSAGLPLTEAIPMVSQSCGNTVIAHSFNGLHKRMVKGEGLAVPMSGDKLFLPLMVQMVRVGEETGSLDNTLLTVSKSYSTEAEYKLKYVISLIQPAMTIFIGLIVGLLALSMTSALYGIYQKGF